MDGDKERLPHRESVAGIENCARLRPDGDRTCQSFRGNNAAFLMKAQMKVAKNLERVNPGFHLPGFVSKQSGAAAGDGKKFPGTIGPRELDRTGRIFRQKLSLDGGKYQESYD